VCKDFGKRSDFENRMTLALAIAEIQDLLHNFESWSRPEHVRSSLAQFPCRSEVRREPKGRKKKRKEKKQSNGRK
jgi:hypothetical protein